MIFRSEKKYNLYMMPCKLTQLQRWLWRVEMKSLLETMSYMLHLQLLLQHLIMHFQPFQFFEDLELSWIISASGTQSIVMSLPEPVVFFPQHFILHFQPVVLFSSTWMLFVSCNRMSGNSRYILGTRIGSYDWVVWPVLLIGPSMNHPGFELVVQQGR